MLKVVTAEKSDGTTAQRAIALIVDDDPADRIIAKRHLTRNSYLKEPIEIREAGSIGEALRILSDTPIEIVLLDMHLGPDPSHPSQNGVENIPEILKRRPFAQILVLTGSDRSKDAARAIKLGAYDFVTKTTPKNEIHRKIADAIAAARFRFEDALKGRVKAAPTPTRLGGKSPEWRQALADAMTYANNDFPVLITGETGTGKTELARVIHEELVKSSGSKAFIPVNIAAISPDLAERELFGNEEEAYTGSTKRKLGYFELADQGTLFLDEIGDASLDLQTKILKAIEEGSFYRLGGDTEVHVKIKVVCATHKNLKKMVEMGTFREDLFMRISTLVIYIPPLSVRKQDTPEIVAAMLPRLCKSAKLKIPVHFEELPHDFISYLVDTPFPGNARGVSQRLARLIIKAPSDTKGKKVFSNWREYFEVEDAPSSPATESPTQGIFDFPSNFSESDFPGIAQLTSNFQERIYREARRQCRSINHVARVLKVSPGTAYSNLKKMGVVTPTRSRRKTTEAPSV